MCVLPVLRGCMGTPTGGVSGLVEALLVTLPVEVPHVAHVQSRAGRGKIWVIS